MAQSFRLKGQTRWHFTNERQSRQKEIVGAIVDSGMIRARLYYGKGDETALRSAIFKQMGLDLVSAGVDRLVIESREQRDSFDRRALYDPLSGSGLLYEHLRPSEDAALWVADAVAWCFSKGGRWRERLEPIIEHVADLGRF